MLKVVSVLALIVFGAVSHADSVRIQPSAKADGFVMDYQVLASGRGCIQFANYRVNRDFPMIVYEGRIERATAFKHFYSLDGFTSVNSESPSIEVTFNPQNRTVPNFKICGFTPGQTLYTAPGLVNEAGTLIYILPYEKSNQATHSVVIR